MPHTGRTIRDLVQGFAQHIRELKATDYKESQLRLHYLDPFWKLLGWDVSNRQQASPQDVEVLVEPSMDTVDDEGLHTREPDYLFRLNGFPRFIVEAKRPRVDVDTDRKAIYQAKRDAWNATIPLAILTDFEQFRLYDTTLKPILTEPGRGLVQEFSINFEDYPSKWEELVAPFGRDCRGLPYASTRSVLPAARHHGREPASTRCLYHGATSAYYNYCVRTEASQVADANRKGTVNHEMQHRRLSRQL